MSLQSIQQLSRYITANHKCESHENCEEKQRCALFQYIEPPELLMRSIIPKTSSPHLCTPTIKSLY